MNYNQFSKLKLSPEVKIAIVVSRFNQQVTQGLTMGAVGAILEVKASLKQPTENASAALEKILTNKEGENIKIFDINYLYNALHWKRSAPFKCFTIVQTLKYIIRYECDLRSLWPRIKQKPIIIHTNLVLFLFDLGHV